MAASLEEEAQRSLVAVLAAKGQLETVSRTYSDAYLRYIRDGLAAHWGWTRMADCIGLSERALRLYWDKHRHRAGRL